MDIDLVTGPRVSRRDLDRIRDQLHPRRVLRAPPDAPPWPDRIVAVGGDGTVNRVLNSLAGRRADVGIVPAGDTNDLARDLGIPASVGDACEVVREGRPAPLDLLSVNWTLFATGGGLEPAAETAEHASLPSGRSRPRIVHLPEAVLRVARGRRPVTVLAAEGGGMRPGIFAILVVGSRPRLCGRISRDAGCPWEEGVIHVMAAEEPCSRLHLALGMLRGSPGCPMHRARELRLETAEDASFVGDGKVLAHGRRFRLRVHPRLVRVMIPAGREP